MTEPSVRRAFDRIEGLVCFALGYLTDGWLAVFWFAIGMLSILGFWRAVESYAVRRITRREFSADSDR